MGSVVLPKFKTAVAAPITGTGRVLSVRGESIQASIPHGAIGELCTVELRGGHTLLAQVVAFNDEKYLLAPLGELDGVHPGAIVRSEGRGVTIELYDEMGGKILDALGRPLNEGHSPHEEAPPIKRPVVAPPPSPLAREAISRQLFTGIRSIDAFTPIGYGQRLALLSRAGMGKSTLLGMITRNAEVDITVIALIGERGREVREFIDDALGESGLKRAVVIVSTSDEPASRRALAAKTAATIAEYFRSKGKRVLLVVDSLTRMTRALREIGLASGEIPVRHGFPSSVYRELPKLVERSGTDETGSITAIYTLLTEEGDLPDPVAEEVKSLLDGHIALHSEVAAAGVWPAIDLTESLSRLTTRLLTPDELSIRRAALEIIARLKRDRDLALLGGAALDPALRAALAVEPLFKKFCSQGGYEKSFVREELWSALKAVTVKFNELCVME